MFDFDKLLKTTKQESPTNPADIYDSLDRASDKGPLRPNQYEILKKWHESRRSESELIIKLHTGQGKTLIGLLMLLSKINETNEPAIYVCPNIQLAHQTCLQAEQFGIPYCTIDNAIPDEFSNGSKILITHVQKVFNGLSKFGLDGNSLEVSHFLLDDAHACVDSIKMSVTLNINNNHSLYTEILELFEEDLRAQGEGSLIEIKDKIPTSLLSIPYWAWQEKSEGVTQIISKYKHESAVKFQWSLIKNIISSCSCIISGSHLEITPYLPPLDKYGSFWNAKNKYFMSATVADDSFLVKGLGVDVETVKNPLSLKEKWSGEKMILIPSLINEAFDRGSILNNITIRKPSDFGTVVLSPSYFVAEEWQKKGSVIAGKDNITEHIHNLNNKNYERIVVFANRYDGIDLPDDACRLLILDSKPNTSSLVDKLSDSCRKNSKFTKKRIAKALEQALGRGVRGQKDYCAVLITGMSLISEIMNSSTRKYISNQVQKQIEIGIDISNYVKDEISKSSMPVSFDSIFELVNKIIKRDDGWKQFYKEKMDSIGEDELFDYDALEIYKLEREAENYCRNGNIEKAKESIQKIINDFVQSDKDEIGWYLQEMARIVNFSDKVEALRIQTAAYKAHQYLMKPQRDISYSKIPYDRERILVIQKWISQFPSFEEMSLSLNTSFENLNFGVESDLFEAALDDLGKVLGYNTDRPDKLIKKGPDNLWCVKSGEYILFECKNEILEGRRGIYQKETGQMSNSIAWFRDEYKNCKCMNIMIIPTSSLEDGAGFESDVRIIMKHQLKILKDSVKSFISSFKEDALNAIDDTRIKQAIDMYNLDLDSIYSIPILPKK